MVTPPSRLNPFRSLVEPALKTCGSRSGPGKVFEIVAPAFCFSRRSLIEPRAGRPPHDRSGARLLRPNLPGWVATPFWSGHCGRWCCRGPFSRRGSTPRPSSHPRSFGQATVSVSTSRIRIHGPPLTAVCAPPNRSTASPARTPDTRFYLERFHPGEWIGWWPARQKHDRACGQPEPHPGSNFFAGCFHWFIFAWPPIETRKSYSPPRRKGRRTSHT